MEAQVFHTIQSITYKRDGVDKTILLMPNEYAEIVNYISQGKPSGWIFERITGHVFEGVTDLQFNQSYVLVSL